MSGAGTGRRPAGLLPVDKPSGVSSFAVVDHVRKALARAHSAPSRERRRVAGARPPRFKVGHAGTLDPGATGLLLVLVGAASRLSPFLLGLDKVYAATVRFGTATDSHDADGAVTATSPPPPDPAAVEAVLSGFRGEILQAPPLISALKRDGKALYKRVRAGEDVAEPEKRPVTVTRLEATGSRWGGPAPEMDLIVACSSGTYIRSLARDIAAAAGSVGHLSALRRLSVGPFDVDDALAGAMDRDGADLAGALIPPADALPHVPALALATDEAAAVRQGQQPQDAWLDRLAAPHRWPDAGGICRLLGPDGALVAVARREATEPSLRLAVVIPAGADQDEER